MKCENCNKDINDTAVYCPHCGAPTSLSYDTSRDTTGGVGNTKDVDASKISILGRLTKKRAVIIVFIMCVFVILELIIVKFIIPSAKYNKAQKLIKEQKYDEAYSILSELNNFNHSSDAIKQSEFDRALALCEEGKYDEGYAILLELGDFNNAGEEILKNKYTRAMALIDEKKYESAYSLLKEIAPYNDAENVMKENIFDRAMELKKEEKYEEAYNLLTTIRGYKIDKDGETIINVDDEIVITYSLSVSAMLKTFYDKDQDGPALKYLRTATSNPDLSEELRSQYATKEKEFKEAALKKAQELFQKSGYDAAIKHLNNVKTYLVSGDTDIANAIAEYKEYIPVDLFKLKYTAGDSYTSSWENGPQTAEDCDGNSYPNCYMIHNSMSENASLVFELEGKYNKLTGTFFWSSEHGRSEYYSDRDVEKLFIYNADGEEYKLLYEITLDCNSKAVKVSVDVSGVNRLLFGNYCGITHNSFADSQYCLSDFKVQK